MDCSFRWANVDALDPSSRPENVLPDIYGPCAYGLDCANDWFDLPVCCPERLASAGCTTAAESSFHSGAAASPYTFSEDDTSTTWHLQHLGPILCADLDGSATHTIATQWQTLRSKTCSRPGFETVTSIRTETGSSQRDPNITITELQDMALSGPPGAVRLDITGMRNE
jgi:hypothetical protein